MDGWLGCDDWDARSDVFPMGQKELYQKIGLHSSAHNRVWADTNRYISVTSNTDFVNQTNLKLSS